MVDCDTTWFSDETDLAGSRKAWWSSIQVAGEILLSFVLLDGLKWGDVLLNIAHEGAIRRAVVQRSSTRIFCRRYRYHRSWALCRGSGFCTFQKEDSNNWSYKTTPARRSSCSLIDNVGLIVMIVFQKNWPSIGSRWNGFFIHRRFNRAKLFHKDHIHHSFIRSFHGTTEWFFFSPGRQTL